MKKEEIPITRAIYSCPRYEEDENIEEDSDKMFSFCKKKKSTLDDELKDLSKDYPLNHASDKDIDLSMCCVYAPPEVMEERNKRLKEREKLEELKRKQEESESMMRCVYAPPEPFDK